MADYTNTILLVHPSSVDPSTFLSRILQGPVDDEATLIPWTIDNKYYTAQVNFLPVELNTEGSLPAGVDVLIYLFERIPNTLPTGLIKSLVDDPKDISLAVRAKTDSTEVVSEDEEWKDVFEEVGFEVIDENAQAEEDDERPISPLETIRQTLMTHLWPSLVRKSTQGPALPAARGLVNDDVDQSEVDEEAESPAQAGPSTFPISFNPSKPLSLAEGSNQKERTMEEEAFPDLAELKAQIELDDFERFGTGNTDGMDRFVMLDSMFRGPGEEEYARLDEWLDADEDGGGFEPLGEEKYDMAGQEKELEQDNLEAGVEDDGGADLSNEGDTGGDVTFDDDFDDFAVYQSAPPKSTPKQVHLTADPTPLLMHLQTVRAELAGLSEEERRIRAGKEVAKVMRDLGFDDVDASDLLGADGDVEP